MPITSVDVPEEMMNYVNSLVRDKKVKSFKDLVVKMLSFHENYSMGEWTDNIIYLYGLRHALVSQRTLNEVFRGMDEEKLYETGRRMGKSLIDTGFARMGRSISKDNWPQALKLLLEDAGWGNFEVTGKTIIVKRPYLPLPVLHGYLETGLGVKLVRLPTSEQIGAYEIRSDS